MLKLHLPQGVTLFHGDCRDALRSLPDNSVDAVPCDPPYELNFMGKGWDDTGIANDPALWAEVYRVLKPGGHLAAFSASRTYHRMACAIEDAGFEIRDSLMWIYGTGFPKSLDVSKTIDKRGGNAHLTREIGKAIKAARESRSMSASECDKMFCGGTTNWSWFEGRPVGQRAPTPETFAAICAQWPELLPLACAVAEVEREVTGQGYRVRLPATVNNVGASYGEYDITAPATDAARAWSGFGTALKPAFEPIVLAREPLSEATVAANVLKWRTGALNIDGCRVGTEGGTKGCDAGPSNGILGNGLNGSFGKPVPGLGRWPANVVTDGSDEVVRMFPHTKNGVAGKRNAQMAT